MLLEAGIADAYGAGFEFASADEIKLKNNLKEYKVHPRYNSIRATYTDDTQMAIAIAELILEEQNWTRIKIANKFVEVFKRDPRRGYSSRFYDILDKVNNGEELLASLILSSNRNGAAMRSYPIGIFENETLVLDKAKLQASVTHNTEEGILSSQIIALSAHYFLYSKGEKIYLKSYLEENLSSSFSFKKMSTLKMEAMPTVSTVISLLLEHNSLATCLKHAINLGGDTDTVASLAISLLSLCKCTKKDLPIWMLKEFEDTDFGKQYLVQLDSKLISKLQKCEH